jgi:hypothetical protein
MMIGMPEKSGEQADIPPCSFDVDIKAFKGKGAFRALKRDHEKVVAQIHNEMQALANELSELDAPMTLVCSVGRKARGTQSARLRWRIRGNAGYDGFEVVQTLLFARVPAALHSYLVAVNQRVQELNALEAVVRYAAAQLDSYVDHGTVKIVARRAGNAVFLPC